MGSQWISEYWPLTFGCLWHMLGPVLSSFAGLGTGHRALHQLWTGWGTGHRAVCQYWTGLGTGHRAVCQYWTGWGTGHRAVCQYWTLFWRKAESLVLTSCSEKYPCRETVVSVCSTASNYPLCMSLESPVEQQLLSALNMSMVTAELPTVFADWHLMLGGCRENVYNDIHRQY